MLYPTLLLFQLYSPSNNLCFFITRLIVVAEKQIVYDKFPIPLINRLEKHFLSMKTMLSPEQCELARKLQNWAEKFCEEKSQGSQGQRQKYDIL